MQKTLIIVLLLSVIALSGVIVYQKLTPTETTPIVVNQPIINQPAVNQPETNQPSTNCVKEGEPIKEDYIGKYGSIPSGVCCSGLTPIKDSASSKPLIEGGCSGIGSDSYACTACGNGICGTGENQCNCPADCKQSTELLNKDFNNSQYKVSLKYPASWTTDRNYDNTGYSGQGGYFSISACCSSISLDEAYKLDAYHKLKPYGTEPKIEDIIIDGQKAKLILPSQDQNSSMNRQAGVVVAYPGGPISIAGSSYYYFHLWADENHIRELAQTVKFAK